MTRNLSVLGALLMTCASALCTPSLPIPLPLQMEKGEGTFTLDAKSALTFNHPEAASITHILAGELRAATGLALPIRNEESAISLSLDSALEDRLGKEGYTLDVRPGGVRLRAARPPGLLYATRTLLQLLPPGVFAATAQPGMGWEVPAVRISDRPAYPWRGMMLDVSRYFFDASYVKRYIDIMAMHKLNVLHLHLVDDPGWRVPIERYPLLTEIGGFRGKGPDRYGGFYSREEIRAIVAYAAERNIEIVPEIELPAHCLSALAAYPWLGCTGEQFETPTTCYISREILCAGKETTYTFLEQVLSEVVDLFPGRYIHIGGDEVKADRWKECPHCQQRMRDEGLKDTHELQSYMTQRMENFLLTKGRRLIGWDEILDGGLAPNATVMTWHRPQTAIQAAQSGNNVVMALTGHAYFDAPESALPGEPPAATWIKPISLQKAYQWEPAPSSMSDADKKFILGAQGCMWTDRFMHNPILQDLPLLDESRSFQYVEYLSLPRMAALAEVTWTPQSQRDWMDFQSRMTVQYNRYGAAGWHFRVPLPRVEKRRIETGWEITAHSRIDGAAIHYRVDGSQPTPYSPRYTEPVVVQDVGDFRAITVATRRHHSLPFAFPEDAAAAQARKYGERIGGWETGKIPARVYKPVTFDATGIIDGNATFEVTFIYSGGTQRLDIESVEAIVNGKVVAQDTHHGVTGGQSKGNAYRLAITDFETGANYTLRASIMGDVGNDSNGDVFLRRVE